MKKSLVLLVLVCFTAFFSVAFKTQEPGWENLQVLSKNTNKKQMDSIMKHFSNSLGVNCDFCHYQSKDQQHDWDFASDTSEHKKIARDMMRMTSDINKKYFHEEFSTNILSDENAITCYSCHNGQIMPATFPPEKSQKVAPVKKKS